MAIKSIGIVLECDLGREELSVTAHDDRDGTVVFKMYNSDQRLYVYVPAHEAREFAKAIQGAADLAECD